MYIKENIFKPLVKEIKDHPLTYVILSLILLSAFIVRVYRTFDLMGFYYDQGRDALVIWKLIHEGKPFLIGPVTGLSGIFLGPLYYYLITPFYIIGGGNPVVPAVFLAFLSVLAILMLYVLGWKFHSRSTGIMAAVIASFSFYIILAGRWLSNPTPVLLTSTILLYSMYKIAHHEDKRWWMIISLMTGLSLQFESASAFFYLPIVGIFTYLYRRHLPSASNIFLTVGILLLTFLPQILFNFRHENLLFNNFIKLFTEGKSFRLDIWTVIVDRAIYFWTVYYSKILPEWPNFVAVFTLLIGVVVFAKKEELRRSKALKLLLLFLAVPVVGVTLFQGNHGNIYDYYMTGFYLPMILLFSVGLGVLWEDNTGKLSVLIFFAMFFSINGNLLKGYLKKDVYSLNNVSLGNETAAVDWVLIDARDRQPSNIDIYVPPVIPHSYDYLFSWRGRVICNDSCNIDRTGRRETVYVLYEVDLKYPNRLEAWLNERENSTEVEEEVRFGGIIVQRRIRV